MATTGPKEAALRALREANYEAAQKQRSALHKVPAKAPGETAKRKIGRKQA